MKNLKRAMLSGLGIATLATGLVASGAPAFAQDGRESMSRQHPDSWAYRDGYQDPAYAAGGVVAGAGNVAGDVVAGAGGIVAGTVGGVTGAVAGDPYYGAPAGEAYYGGPGAYNGGPGYYGNGRVIFRNGHHYVRRGAYYYPTGGRWVQPHDVGYDRANGGANWDSNAQYHRGGMVRGTSADTSDYPSQGPDF